MPDLAPCRACLPLDGTGYLESPANPFSVYSLESPPFIPLINCPPGFDCAHAPFLFMDCCGTQLFENLLGTSSAERSQKIQGMLNRCNLLWESCNTVDTGGSVLGTARGPSLQFTRLPLFYNNPACFRSQCFGNIAQYCLPPGTVLSPLSQAAADALAGAIARQRSGQGKVTLGNTRQCYTAACVGGDPYTTTQCVEANIFGDCLFFPSPGQAEAAQQALDAQALAVATANANNLLAAHGCLVCNTEKTGTAACPGNPAKIATLTIPAGTYCLAAGSLQSIVDAQASQALYTALQNALALKGCVCLSTITLGTYVNGNCLPGQTVVPDLTIHFTCDAHFFMSPPETIPQPIFVPAGSFFNWHDSVGTPLGICTRQGTITFTPFDYTAPPFTFYSG